MDHYMGESCLIGQSIHFFGNWFKNSFLNKIETYLTYWKICKYQFNSTILGMDSHML